MVERPSSSLPALVGIALVATVGGLLVTFLAVDLFPFHSANHDEGVYLQHARILLSGRLWMTTPLPETFHHWFFVRDGSRLYAKYQPVIPAMFALGIAVETPRLILGAVATGIAGLVGLLTRAAYDGRTGILASGLLVGTPLFLVNTALFLPYAPTTLLNLTFAYAYVRAIRADGRWLRWSLLAGTAVGLAFFARPYTAVLFALPFISHAVARLASVPRDWTRLRHTATRLFPTAAVGGVFVGITLGYNVLTTGNPGTFPYQAFAPADGLGFGTRRILGYQRTYTPMLALRANAQVLWEFATRWTIAPPFGALAGLAGAGLALRDAVGTDLLPEDDPLPDGSLRLVFVGVAISVGVGNLGFWGNLNILADLSDPTDGLIAQFGPFYHYDLLLPLSALSAAAVVRAADRVASLLRGRVDSRTMLAVGMAIALVVTPMAAAAQTAALTPPIEENREYTERFQNAYEPITENGELQPPEGIILLPTPYGPWLGHPFQALRNPGDLRRGPVFALDRGAPATFALVDEYPDAQYHRFTFRGEWTPDPRGPVHGAIQPLEIRSGSSHTLRFESGVVGRPSTVRLADSDEAVTYRVMRNPNRSFSVRMLLDGEEDPGHASVVSPGLVPNSASDIEFQGSDEITLAVTYVQAGGATVTYRLELAVDAEQDGIRVVWPPSIRVCRLTPDCGYEGTYLPGKGKYLSGVRANVTLSERS